MILEGFEIENWSCIKRIAVDSLPPTGVVVLHGPNATGKSSIVAALRACLMDYIASATSKDLKRYFARDGSSKPRVSVTFRAQGVSWRITKQFGGKESKLESRTTAGAWKVEQSTASDSHEQVKQLIGGKKSDAGLQQLLWLNQAEFQLPELKEFDSDLQTQLRGVLGVLQTPLDDRFVGRVKVEWGRWFGARSKAGDKPKLKKDCPHDKALAALKVHQDELIAIEERYRGFEMMMEKSGNLEVQSRDLRRQQKDKVCEHDLLQEEYEKSQKRLETYRRATDCVETAEKAVEASQERRRERAEKEQRMREAERQAETAGRVVEEKERLLLAAEQRLRDLRQVVEELQKGRRSLQDRSNAVVERLKLLALNEKSKTAQENLKQAEQTAGEIEDVKKQAREHPAPAAEAIEELEENRRKAAKARADLEAAAIVLTLFPNAGAAVLGLVIDGTLTAEAGRANDETPNRQSFRRQAKIAIPNWGRVELTRGSDSRSLDQIESELNELDHGFTEGLAPFGLAAGDPTALDQLRSRWAEKKVRDPVLKSKQEEISRLAPNGLELLREEIARIENLLSARDSDLESFDAGNDLPTTGDDLERLAGKLKKDIEGNEAKIRSSAQEVEQAEREIDGPSGNDVTPLKRSGKADKSKSAAIGLRRQEAEAKEALAALNATVVVHRGELGRMLTVEQIEKAIGLAEESLGAARGDLEAAKLSESEETIRDRLAAAKEGLNALGERLAAAENELHQIKGAMSQTEGLHQKRTAAAARVEALARQTEHETLESEAYDRLYALFEECREKQIGAVMGPIHDRVLRWMRLVRMGDCQSIRFNDHLLPERLVASDGVTERALGEESTGTIEQFAMMVRLALGSMLSTAQEPAVAVLDDPLTHSDVVRLDRMRAVLKSAAGGDAASKPPAGPLQILVFTCHPEWFAVEGAKIIDLSKSDVLSKSC